MAKFWVMAGAYFGLYSFLLTVVPTLAVQHGRSDAEASVLVAVMALVGFVGDVTISRVSRRIGAGRVVVGGAVIAASGLSLTAIASGLVPLVVASALIGLGLPYLATPVLGGLSTRAGSGHQVRAQAVNAIVQRGGALALSLSLGSVMTNAGLMLAVAAAAFAVLAIGGMLMHREQAGRVAPGDGGSAARTARPITWRSLARRPEVCEGLFVNAAIPLWIVAGSSLFPLMLLTEGDPDLLVPAIVAREVLSLVVAAAVARVVSRRLLRGLWVSAMVVGAVGFSLTPSVGHPILIVICFALHGSCIGLGIVLANTLFHDGTNRRERLVAFAMGSMSARATALAFPLLCAAALAESVTAAAVLPAIVAAVLCIAVIVRAAIRPHDSSDRKGDDR